MTATVSRAALSAAAVARTSSALLRCVMSTTIPMHTHHLAGDITHGSPPRHQPTLGSVAVAHSPLGVQFDALARRLLHDVLDLGPVIGMHGL